MSLTATTTHSPYSWDLAAIPPPPPPGLSPSAPHLLSAPPTSCFPTRSYSSSSSRTATTNTTTTPLAMPSPTRSLAGLSSSSCSSISQASSFVSSSFPSTALWADDFDSDPEEQEEPRERDGGDGGVRQAETQSICVGLPSQGVNLASPPPSSHWDELKRGQARCPYQPSCNLQGSGYAPSSCSVHRHHVLHAKPVCRGNEKRTASPSGGEGAVACSCGQPHPVDFRLTSDYFPHNRMPLIRPPHLMKPATGPTIPVVMPTPQQPVPAVPCDHVESWKRLRAKKGFGYYSCQACGLRWKVPSNANHNKRTA